MKESFDQQVRDLARMKEEAKEKQVQDEIQHRKRNQQISNEIQVIKDGVDCKIKQIEQKFEQIRKKQEEIIDNGAFQKYNQIILSTITDQQFLKLDDEMKENFVKVVQKKTQKMNNKDDFNKRMHFLQLIISIQFLSEKENVGSIQLIRDDVKIDNLRIDVGRIGDIYEKGLLLPILIHCFNNCNNFTIDVEYPCNKICRYYEKRFLKSKINNRETQIRRR